MTIIKLCCDAVVSILLVESSIVMTRSGHVQVEPLSKGLITLGPNDSASTRLQFSSVNQSSKSFTLDNSVINAALRFLQSVGDSGAEGTMGALESIARTLSEENIKVSAQEYSRQDFQSRCSPLIPLREFLIERVDQSPTEVSTEQISAESKRE
jgi:hypothetical protein